MQYFQTVFVSLVIEPITGFNQKKITLASARCPSYSSHETQLQHDQPLDALRILEIRSLNGTQLYLTNMQRNTDPVTNAFPL